MKDYDTLKIELTVPSSASETASYVLSELGGVSQAFESAEDPKAVRIVAHLDPRSFDADALASDISRSLERMGALEGAGVSVRRETIPDFTERFRQLFAPFALAPGLVVVPSWEDYAPRPDERIIRIDPGMAFGTGLHETTRLCAELVRRLAPGASSLIDVGTGSGILAIAARLLGVGRVCAVENDPDALSVASENFSRNGCDDIELLPSLSKSRAGFDIVVANILLGTLIDLSRDLARRLSPGGSLVLSGITADQEEDIMCAFSPDASFVEAARMGEWSAMLFRKGS